MRKILLSTFLCLATSFAMSQYVQGTIVQNSSNPTAVDIYGKSATAYNYPIIEFDFVVSIPSTSSAGVTATASSNIILARSNPISSTITTIGARTYYTFNYKTNQAGNTTTFNANTPLLMATVTFTGLSGNNNSFRLTDENYAASDAVNYWYLAADGVKGQDSSGEISADPNPPFNQQVYYANTGKSTIGGSGKVQYAETIVSSILPVTIASFIATKAVGKVNIAWATVTETNVANFTVQRSVNSVDFAPIVIVAAIGSGENKYATVDASPLAGTAFYRLKSIDKDGSFSYSNIVAVTFDASGSVSVYPSPALSYINVTVSDPKLYGTVFTLVDLAGHIVKSFTITGNAQQFNISNIATGIYFIKMADGSSVKFIKK